MRGVVRAAVARAPAAARGLVAAAAAGRWALSSAAVALAVVWLGKHYYSQAGADELRWILAPTARLVSWISGAEYAYERGAGYVSREQAFLIAPACAGVNFALAAWLALVAGGAPRVRTARGLMARLAAAAAVAYVATLVVNTTRISLAIALHHGALEVESLSAAELHRAEGIAVYLVGLCGLYLGAQAVERALARRAIACARSGGRAGRVVSGELLVRGAS